MHSKNKCVNKCPISLGTSCLKFDKIHVLLPLNTHIVSEGTTQGCVNLTRVFLSFIFWWVTIQAAWMESPLKGWTSTRPPAGAAQCHTVRFAKWLQWRPKLSAMRTEHSNLHQGRFIATQSHYTALAGCALTSQAEGNSSKLPLTLSLIHLLDFEVPCLCPWQWLLCQRWELFCCHILYIPVWLQLLLMLDYYICHLSGNVNASWQKMRCCII